MFRKLKNLAYKLHGFTVTAKEKAFVGGMVAGVGAYLDQNGLTYHDLLSWHIVQALVVFLATHQAIYWTSNRQA